MAKKRPLMGLRFSVTKQMTAALHEGADVLEEAMAENISLDDHTLEELARLGYPYSTRNPQQIHTPDFQVHTQSGRMLDALTQRQINQYAIDVGVDDSQAPEIVHVLYGTSKMVARNFVSGTYEQVKPILTRLMRNALAKAVREAK